MVPRLTAAGLRVLVPEQRGYGPRARPPHRRDYALPPLVADVTALLDLLPGPVHLVGHDWGGVVAWAFAAAHPERLASLTVLSQAHPAAYRAAVTNSSQAWRSAYVGAFQVPVLPEALLTAGGAACSARRCGAADCPPTWRPGTHAGTARRAPCAPPSAGTGAAVRRRGRPGAGTDDVPATAPGTRSTPRPPSSGPPTSSAGPTAGWSSTRATGSRNCAPTRSRRRCSPLRTVRTGRSVAQVSDSPSTTALRVPLATLDGTLHLPLVGLGTYGLRGDPGYRSLRDALDVGYRLLDTATMYENEERWAAPSPTRRCPTSASPRSCTTSTRAARTSSSSAACACSAWTSSTCGSSTGRPGSGAAGRVGADGRRPRGRRVRAVGVSNYSLAQLDELTDATGVTPAVNQVKWGPALHDADLLAAHRDRASSWRATPPSRPPTGRRNRCGRPPTGTG